ncbi:hypothetical protein D3C85_1520680 [compost metagenome]
MVCCFPGRLDGDLGRCLLIIKRRDDRDHSLKQMLLDSGGSLPLEREPVPVLILLIFIRTENPRRFLIHPRKSSLDIRALHSVFSQLLQARGILQKG